MRWLLLLIAVSASADCTSGVLYDSVDDVIPHAVVDDGGVYFSFLTTGNLERLDLQTGQTSFVGDRAYVWDVQNGFIATAATIGRAENTIKGFEVRDGYVYWLESDAVLRRMLVGGSTTDIVASNVTQFAIFEDRVVFIAGGQLFSKALVGGAPVLILPNSNVISIGGVSADSIIVTIGNDSGSFYIADQSVVRVSWDGASVQPIYEMKASWYHNPWFITAVTAGATTYVSEYQQGLERGSLIAIRDGISRELINAYGPLPIIDATEDAVRFLTWGHGTGMHQIVQLCVDPHRVRAVR